MKPSPSPERVSVVVPFFLNPKQIDAALARFAQTRPQHATQNTHQDQSTNTPYPLLAAYLATLVAQATQSKNIDPTPTLHWGQQSPTIATGFVIVSLEAPVWKPWLPGPTPMSTTDWQRHWQKSGVRSLSTLPPILLDGDKDTMGYAKRLGSALHDLALRTRSHPEIAPALITAPNGLLSFVLGKEDLLKPAVL